MTKTTLEKGSATRQRGMFGIRMPSGFWMASGAALLSLAVWVGWILLDGRFAIALLFFRYDIGLESLEYFPPTELDSSVKEAHEWQELGQRIAWMFLLAGCGFASFLVVAVQTLFGNTAPSTLKRCLASFVLFLAAVALLSGYESIRWMGQRLRANWALPRFKAVAAKLLNDWPQDAVWVDVAQIEQSWYLVEYK